MPNAREPQQLERLAPGRDQIGEVGDIVSESPGDFISVHPGDFVGIRKPEIYLVGVGSAPSRGVALIGVGLIAEAVAGGTNDTVGLRANLNEAS